MDDAGQRDRGVATALAKRFGAWGIKLNVGKDPAAREIYMANLRQWWAQLPLSVSYASITQAPSSKGLLRSSASSTS